MNSPRCRTTAQSIPPRRSAPNRTPGSERVVDRIGRNRRVNRGHSVAGTQAARGEYIRTRPSGSGTSVGSNGIACRRQTAETNHLGGGPRAALVGREVHRDLVEIGFVILGKAPIQRGGSSCWDAPHRRRSFRQHRREPRASSRRAGRSRSTQSGSDCETGWRQTSISRDPDPAQPVLDWPGGASWLMNWAGRRGAANAPGRTRRRPRKASAHSRRRNGCDK